MVDVPSVTQDGPFYRGRWWPACWGGECGACLWLARQDGSGVPPPTSLGQAHRPLRRTLPRLAVPVRAVPWDNFSIRRAGGWYLGRARSPWLWGARKYGLLLAQPSHALPTEGSASDRSRAWRNMGQNGLISSARVGKTDPFRFISSESVTKRAGDSCAGNLFCYDIFHLPGAGFGGRSLSPCAVIRSSGARGACGAAAGAPLE